MILYFTATGNCKYIAQCIANEIEDEIMNFADASNEIALKSGESLGIVTPTYHWNVPSIIKKYLSEIQIKMEQNSYVYYVSTYGTTCGKCGVTMKELLAEKGIELKASYSVKMPDNWTPTFDLSNKEKVRKINKAEKPQIAEIMAHIQNQDKGNFMTHQLPKVLCNMAEPFSKSASRTSHFKVEDSCVGCGLCGKNCPVQAIQMKDGKPVWVKESCAMCLRCLHHCPKFAIQYDNRTKKHGQYVHP